MGGGKPRALTARAIRAPGRKGRRRRTLPQSLLCSTIRATRLNDRVRDGNGCDPRAIDADQKESGCGKLRLRASVRSVGEVEEDRCVTEVWTDQASRAISTAWLRPLLVLHLRPINVLVSNGPSEGLRPGKIGLGGSFPLRCFQRFSRPDVATRRCHRHDSRYTRGQSVPVLSY